jgi:hypothetical protein
MSESATYRLSIFNTNFFTPDAFKMHPYIYHLEASRAQKYDLKVHKNENFFGSDFEIFCFFVVS